MVMLTGVMLVSRVGITKNDLVLTLLLFVFFFFNDTATTEIYTLSLHDALPICIKHRLIMRTLHVASLTLLMSIMSGV